MIVPDHDPPLWRRAGEVIAREVLDARLVTIEGADHVVNMRRPEAFDAAVLPFLDDAGREAGI